MRMAKSPRECARVVGWMREIKARGSVPDRSVHINQIGVEKSIFDSVVEINANPKTNCSGPENRDASILVGKCNANAKEFSTVFEHLDRSRRPHRSNRRRKIDFRFCSKINANP